MDFDLKEKKVLITGATGGIGKETVKVFAQEGADIIIHYQKNLEGAKELVQELNKNFLIVQANLQNENDVQKMFQIILKKKGRIDILVCNAGIWPEEHKHIAEMSFERWKNTLAVDLDSVFLCCRSFLNQLKAFPGDNANIVIIGSTAGIFGEAGHADYATAKAAIIYGFTKSLKNEIVSLAKLGRVNAVCPGWTVTPMNKAFLADKEAIRKVLQTIPLRKIAQAEDVAYMIAFLASDKSASHISGEIITIAGGMEGRVLYEPEEIDLNMAYK